VTAIIEKGKPCYYMIQVDPITIKSGNISVWFEIINQDVTLMQGIRNNTSPIMEFNAQPVVGAPIKTNITGAVIVVKATQTLKKFQFKY